MMPLREYNRVQSRLHLRALQAKIGETLQRHYAVADPLPGRLTELLRELDEGENVPIGTTKCKSTKR